MLFRTLLQTVRTAPQSGPRPVVVLDLDSTLIHTGARHLAIARAFAAEQGALDHVAGLSAADFGWGVDEPLRARGVDEAFLEALLAYWQPRFFDGAWLVHDQPAPGAVAFVQRLVDADATVVYLTARAAPTMGAATVASLAALGFPLFSVRTLLHMKPSVHLDDGRFKRASIHALRALGPVVATFENEPAHANAFAEAFPDATHVLVGDVHHPKAPAPSPGVLRVPDFQG